MITTVKITNPDNDKFKTEGGNDTEDKIFLLSIDEVKSYFSSARFEKPEDRTKQDCRGQVQWWWLRSPGRYSNFGTFVFCDGYIYVDGSGVDAYVGGVCPVFWINLNP